MIPTEHTAWPRTKRRRIAGVSSFGFGGTNTHLIVESAGERVATLEQNGSLAEISSSERPLHLLKLSAKSEAALQQQAGQLAALLEQEPDSEIADVCWSANTGWADFNYRAVVTATDTAQLQQRLAAFATGETASAAGVKQATVRSIGRPNVAFLFTGQGAQYVGMGRGLYDTQPVFRRALDKCDAVLRKCWGGESLLKILYPADSAAKGEDALLHQTQYTQPALFALEYALAELWASWGVKPDIVLGHSVGEYAAACIAGVMSLEDGLRLIAERARLMQNVKRHGKMAVVFASRERVAKEIEAAGSEVVIAVLNGPENIVISGDAAGVEKLSAKFEADGVQVKPLNVSHAFHSPLMDEMLDTFEKFAAGIEFHAPQVPLAANLTGQLMTEAPTAAVLARPFAECGAVCSRHDAHRRSRTCDHYRNWSLGQLVGDGAALRAKTRYGVAALTARRPKRLDRHRGQRQRILCPRRARRLARLGSTLAPTPPAAAKLSISAVVAVVRYRPDAPRADAWHIQHHQC